MGNEQEGLSPKVRRRCDAIVTIPTTGSMQSLNVSVAAGVILSELRRRQPQKKASTP
jgi:tRNA G18 (ribose-2'-O)-methylase SpoU